MKIILYLFDLVPRIIAEPAAQAPSGGSILNESPRAEHILLFGLRSPGDQLHVVAIRSYQVNQVAWIGEKS
jgi:hypothetical protein